MNRATRRRFADQSTKRDWRADHEYSLDAKYGGRSRFEHVQPYVTAVDAAGAALYGARNFKHPYRVRDWTDRVLFAVDADGSVVSHPELLHELQAAGLLPAQRGTKR